MTALHAPNSTDEIPERQGITALSQPLSGPDHERPDELNVTRRRLRIEAVGNKDP